MLATKIRKLCECTGDSCDLTVDIPISEYEKISRNGWFIQVSGCKTNLYHDYMLVKQGDGWVAWTPKR